MSEGEIKRFCLHLSHKSSLLHILSFDMGLFIISTDIRRALNYYDLLRGENIYNDEKVAQLG